MFTQSHGGVGPTPIMGTQRNKSKSSTRQVPILNHGMTPGMAGTLNVDPKVNGIAQEEFDEYGAELRKDARVWKAYVKEADKFDMEQVDGWNRSLDVTLIFAALFTAICTAFVIESSKSLKVDATETSARRLDQMTSILLVIANASSPQELNSTQILSPEPFSPRPMDLCINVLWFFSLILSAAVSLVAMLAKEWCYLFISGRIGDPWSQTKRRQQRWEGIENWRMEQVIMILPSFIHLAFLSFAAGLCIYLGDLNWIVAVPAAVVTFGLTLVYVASTLLPLFNRTCPYSTSISRLIRLLPRFKNDKNSGNDDGSPDSISVRALAWLIGTSEDPKSTDTALQAIAGADPNDADRQLLKDSGADKMILRRLIGLESYSRNYDMVLDLYTRAQSFFQPSPAVTTPRNEPSTSIKEKPIQVIPGSKVEAKESTGTPRKSLNRELQKKLRDLRDTIEEKITTYATSGSAFLPSADNIQALRIGSTAASYCLRSLQNSTQALGQTQEQFDSAVELLESYREGEAHLNTREIQYLMTGAAMLLSSLLVDCPPDMGAQYVMRLLRIAGRAGDGQKPLRLEYLRLPMVVYALSRYDYPGWTQPHPLSSISRAERAIEMIAHYVLDPKDLKKVTSIMINLGLLELLSSPEECKLDDDDIEAIAEAFDPVADDNGQVRIHTLSTNSHAEIYSRPLKTMTTMILNERQGLLSGNAVAIACLTVLNRTRVDDSTAAIPLGQVYAFVTECVLNLPPLGSEAYGQNVALDLMQKFHDYPNWTQDLFLDLARSLGGRDIIAKLKAASEAEVTNDNQGFVFKLFATGQAWFLINLAIMSETADHDDWKCLKPFTGDESSSELVMRRLGEQRNALAERYRKMCEDDYTRRHNYFEILYHSLPQAGTIPSSP
ncbi:unnamed protein product [Rhizoctonia solani]|uniref:DUF6535 domain-containing protein n=1 Tax=Rhizoctonia solani TaxID=456999 RepID=A0A8H2XKG5_9AGAM|nr:unnamed protein product [Rhizoctonia solani]